MSEAAITPQEMVHARTRTMVAPFAVTIMVSAFLLFQVEFIISKYLLPWFGGTAALWTTTMLVFQCLLFLAYGYAHLIASRIDASRQRTIHLSLVALSVLGLAITGALWPSPLTPGASWKPSGPGHPVTWVIVLTLLSTGLPFFCLSATSPLLQSWYARGSENSPYRLFAFSNVGSLIGLISYPLVVEPLLRLKVQSWGWLAVYGVYVIGIAFCAAGGGSRTITTTRTSAGEPKVSATSRLLWLLLSMCSSVALLAFTNMMSQYVAAVPLLWAVPLALYLVSFIVCFGAPAVYRRTVFYAAYAITLMTTVIAIASGAVRFEVASMAALLLVMCMICHGELVQLQPGEGAVTSYYLSISGGGAIGAIFAGVLAPVLFQRFWEFELSIIAAGILAIGLAWRDVRMWTDRTAWRWPAFVLLILALIPWVGAHFNASVAREIHSLRYVEAAVVAALPIILSLVILFLRPREAATLKPARVAAIAFLSVASLCLLRMSWGFQGKMISRSRSFYGVLEVQEDRQHLILVHGKTVHGAQALDPRNQNKPSTYYAANSGIGLFLQGHPKRNAMLPMRIGVVGLGIGTLAAYGLPGDSFRFYEIDPGVIDLAAGSSAPFSYLSSSKSDVKIVAGDARLSLEREANAGQPQGFDVLVVDAFSGDAVPVHLLTREAIQTYRAHLAPGGALALHISNSALDLTPVLLGITEDSGLHATMMYVEETSYDSLASTWVILAENPAVLNTPALRERGSALSVGRRPVVWTDDYTNVIPLLRW